MATRTVSTTSTIPEYASKTGALTTDLNNPTILHFLGVDDETPEYLFGEGWLGKKNLYVYWADELKNITGILVNGLGDITLNIESAFTTALDDDSVYIVEANLKSFTCTNQGNAVGVFDGANIAPTVTVNKYNSSVDGLVNGFVKPVVVDGTGTEFLITENG